MSIVIKSIALAIVAGCLATEAQAQFRTWIVDDSPEWPVRAFDQSTLTINDGVASVLVFAGWNAPVRRSEGTYDFVLNQSEIDCRGKRLRHLEGVGFRYGANTPSYHQTEAEGWQTMDPASRWANFMSLICNSTPGYSNPYGQSTVEVIRLAEGRLSR